MDEQKRVAYSEMRKAIYAYRLLVGKRCEHCGKPGTGILSRQRKGWSLHAHHDDYSRPLDVTWLCHVCHRALHHERNAESFATARCPRCGALPGHRCRDNHGGRVAAIYSHKERVAHAALLLEER